MEVIRRLRGWTEAPIIVLSGQASGLGEVVVMDARAGDYLSRPWRGQKSLAGSRPVCGRDSDTHPVRIALQVFVGFLPRKLEDGGARGWCITCGASAASSG